jgi:hypothetical protein
MSEHTKGTWHVSRHGVPDGVYQSGIYAEGNGRDLAIVKSCEADARLMAAAPNLLAALKELLACPDLNLDDLDPFTLGAIHDARNAVAKAVQS